MQICHILLTVLSGVFLFGFLVSTCVYLYGGALPAATFENTSVSTEASTNQLSLTNAVQYTIDKFIAFLRVGTSTGITLTEQLSVEVGRKLNMASRMGLNINWGKAKELDHVSSWSTAGLVSLADGVHTAMNALLEKYTIRALLNTGDQLQVDVNILDQNMLFIRKTNQFTSGQVSQIQGSLKTIHGFITTELNKLCLKGLGTYLDTQCKQLQAKSLILNISFDPSALEVDPPAVLNFVLNDFGINLQLILNQFEKVTQKLNETEMDILLKVLEFVDVQTILKPMRRFWQQLDVQIDSMSTTAQTTVTSIENGLTTAKPLLLLAIYLPAVIFVGLLATAIVLFVLYLFEALESNLFLTEPPTNHQGE
ncbi:unnamed protein product [Dibothriocephalus latus]|uniref:Uncharacterized protein n=1 Tax=Dibothriocephalus latus TaxID=60516 RepID=A0A3P6SV22_DIBLA|nr:unnamed protein product [Dibothriocephalus latus]